MNQVIYPFTITAAQLNVADTEDVSILTLGTNARMIRVPTRLEVYRAAGTAYAFAQGQYVYRLPDHRDSTEDFQKGGEYLIVRSVTAVGNQNDVQQELFRIPVHGLLNQAAAIYFLALPETQGKVFIPGATSLVLRASCGISGGTGALTCRLYYDEYPMPQV